MDHDIQGLLVDNQRFASSIADQTTRIEAEAHTVAGEGGGPAAPRIRAGDGCASSASS
jgi:hypothetical protein